MMLPPIDARLIRMLRDLVQLHLFTDPLYDQNCYVLRRRDTDRCLVVDPGLQAAAVLRLLEGEGSAAIGSCSPTVTPTTWPGSRR